MTGEKNVHREEISPLNPSVLGKSHSADAVLVQQMRQEAHIVPTELNLIFLYSTGVLHERPVRTKRPFNTGDFCTTGPE
jgi:hypothetical protein